MIVVHEWWGLNDYAKRRARDLAALGYSALAVDMYGDGRNTQHPDDAKAFMNAALADPAIPKARFQAGLDLLKAQPQTDPARLAAIAFRVSAAVRWRIKTRVSWWVRMASCSLTCALLASSCRRRDRSRFFSRRISS